MNITISGQGPAVLFIHGYCETQRIWEPYHEALSKIAQVVSIDLPGHGISPVPNPGFTIDEIAKQVHEALLDSGISSYFLIGHSLGGYIALSLLDQFPENVAGLGLFSSTTFPDDDEKKKARDKVQGFLEEHGVSTFIDSFVPGLFTPENRAKLPGAIAALAKEGKKMAAETIYGYAQAMKNRPDRTHLIEETDVPVFVIAGDRDMAVRLDVSHKIIKKIKTGDALVLKDVGHQGFVEAEKESLTFIQNFITQHLI